MSRIYKIFNNRNIFNNTISLCNTNKQILNVRYFTNNNNNDNDNYNDYDNINNNLSNLDLTKLNKTCINYDYIAKLKEFKNIEKKINIDSELLKTFIHNIDYHTLMALKHASCGAIDISFIHKKNK